MTSYSQVKPKIKNSLCICQIGNAKTVRELIKQLNAWDKEALTLMKSLMTLQRTKLKTEKRLAMSRLIKMFSKIWG